MKTNKEYDFRVGDYVEANGETEKKFGYITKITRQCLNDDGDIFYSIEAACINYEPALMITFNGTIELLKKSFNRIGKYDFTKPENPMKSVQTKPLPTKTVYSSTGWHATIIDKINELVKAVNELRSNKNEYGFCTQKYIKKISKTY